MPVVSSQITLLRKLYRYTTLGMVSFAYRAQVLQKRVFWFQMLQKGAKPRQRAQVLGAWLFSWFLFLLAGYGYRVWRSFLAYVLVIVGFTML